MKAKRTYHRQYRTWYWKNCRGDYHRDDGGPAVIDEGDGSMTWYVGGVRQRSDGGPVEIDAGNCGKAVWERNGRPHRDGDLPAIIRDSCMEWFRDGKLHRDGDLPASISVDGHMSWYRDGKLHRDGDLPAIVMRGHLRYQCWYQHGRPHRDNGLPAVINYDADGQVIGEEYWEHGKRYRVDGKPVD